MQIIESTSRTLNSEVFILDTKDDISNTYSDNGQNTYINVKRYENIHRGDIQKEFREMQRGIMEKHIPILTKLLDETSFDCGYKSKAEEYFDYLYDEYEVIACSILQNIYLKNMYNNLYIVKHLLFIAANIEADKRADLEILPLAGLSNPDLEVQDLSVRCIEAWEDKRHIPTLTALREKVSVSWLKEYISEVVDVLSEG